VRAHYVTSVIAAPLMVRQESGLIVNVSSDGAEKDDAGVSYGVAKAATDRMVACELARQYGFTDLDGRQPGDSRTPYGH
jgi:NAD(P)-dependent dehydrogenase (short-subunit alcohol dehydrogenase family)